MPRTTLALLCSLTLLAATSACSPGGVEDVTFEPAAQLDALDPHALAVPPHARLQSPVVPAGGYVLDEVIIAFDGAVPEVVALDEGELAGQPLQLARTVGNRRAGVFGLPEGLAVDSAVEALRSSGRFRYVEPNYLVTALATVDDPLRSSQWHFDTVQAEEAWELSTGSGIVVAVIDTGVSDEGSDGLGALTDGWDVIDWDSDATDDTHGHGTHVAGTIAQASDNGVGTAGLAHGASVMPLKVLAWDATTGEWQGSMDMVVFAVDFAVLSGAHVINMSLGTPEDSELLEEAVADAHAAGRVVVAAAGNASTATPYYPAAHDHVLSVGAVTYNEARAWYSNGGLELDLMAPGGGGWVDADGGSGAQMVLQESFDPVDGTWQHDYPMAGTSMAAPHVAASAALMMSLCATNQQAEDYLILTATDLGSSGWDELYGHGLIQAASALEALLADTDLDDDGYVDFVEGAVTFCERPPSAACLADFNGDGSVDAADYTVWADNEGCTSCAQSEGDASGDGLVDAVDYQLWVDSFGETCTGG